MPKSDIPHIDHPPRPSLHPESTRKWLVTRVEETKGVGVTRFWFAERTKPPTLEINRIMTDEEIDLLRLAYDRGERNFANIDALLTNDELLVARLQRGRDLAPLKWRQAVGLELLSGN